MRHRLGSGPQTSCTSIWHRQQDQRTDRPSSPPDLKIWVTQDRRENILSEETCGFDHLSNISLEEPLPPGGQKTEVGRKEGAEGTWISLQGQGLEPSCWWVRVCSKEAHFPEPSAGAMDEKSYLGGTQIENDARNKTWALSMQPWVCDLETWGRGGRGWPVTTEEIQVSVTYMPLFWEEWPGGNLKLQLSHCTQASVSLVTSGSQGFWESLRGFTRTQGGGQEHSQRTGHLDSDTQK